MSDDAFDPPPAPVSDPDAILDADDPPLIAAVPSGQRVVGFKGSSGRLFEAAMDIADKTGDAIVMPPSEEPCSKSYRICLSLKGLKPGATVEIELNLS